MTDLTTNTVINRNAMSSTAVMRNVIANFAQFSLRFLIGIWFTRFLIQSIGTELYGMVPLAWNLTQYFALITLVVNAPAGRYLIIEISRGDINAANKIFNTVFWGISGLSLVLLLVAIIVSWSFPFVFKVPLGHEIDVRFIFLAVSGAFVLTTFSNPLSLSTYVTNKLYLQSLNDSLQLLIRVGIAFSFIVFFSWGLGAVSLGIWLAAVIGLFITIAFWRHLTPALKIKSPNINIPMLKDITGMGGWMLVNQIGALLFLHTELFVVNFLYGADATGRYGALLLFPTTLRSIAQMISSTLTPPIMDRYAKGDIEGVIRLVCRATRLLGLLIALPLGLICGFSVPLLKIWLGSEFVDLSLILIVLTAHLCVNISVLPLFTLQVMAKKVKVPGLITLVMGIINILLAVILGMPKLGIGLLGIAMAGAIVLTIKNAIFTPLYGAHIINKNKMFFFPSMAAGITGFLVLVASIFIILKLFEITSIFQLLTAFIAVSLGYLVFVWSYILNKEDKTWLLNISRNLIKPNETTPGI